MTASLPTFRPIRRAATLARVAVLAGVCAAPAAAQSEETRQTVFGPAIDWSVLARLTETVQADTNRRLNGDNEGVEASGSVAVGLTVAGRGKRSQFNVSTNVRAGRSTDNTVGNLDRIDPNLSATAVFLGKGYSINASVNAQTRDTTTSEVEDAGVTNLDVTRFDAGASVGVNWQATKRDSLSLTATAQFVDFSRSVGSLSPSQTFGVSGAWSRAVTPTTSYSFTTNFRHFDADGVNGRTSRTASAQFGIQHRRTSRHSLGASAGLSFVSTDNDNAAKSTQIGFVGGGSFGYTIDEFNASLNLSQSIQPSSDGELRAFTSLGGNLAYRINEVQRLSFGVRYSRRSDVSGGGDVLQFLSLGPSYSYSLTEDSTLSLGYQFRLRDDETNDFETGHQLMLTLSHQLTVLQ